MNFVANLKLTPEKQNKNSIRTKHKQVVSVSMFISSSIWCLKKT